MSCAGGSGSEIAVNFACGNDALVGIVCVPAASGPVGVLVVVGGPQYRAGSHRQFVSLARHLCDAGHVTMRFDVRGMGDSAGAERSFEQIGADIDSAIGALLATCPQVTRVVLWGLCDGASAALLYVHNTRDDRVAGLCLVNPWVRSAAGLARTHVRHYYAQRLTERAFWSKLLRGGVGVGALRGAATSLLTLVRSRTGAPSNGGSYQDRMAAAWHGFARPLLVVLSGNDYTAREFADQVDAGGNWRGAWQHPHVKRLDLEGADHTFSQASDRIAVENATARWLATAGV